MLLWLIFCNILFLGICLNIKSKSLSGWQCRAALPRQQTALFLSLFGLAIKCLFSALYNGPYMIWRSNITVWNSHDVLLLLFTSTLGVIIEVNIFYTNTIPRGLSLLRWDLSPSSKHLHCASGFGDAQRDHRDGLVASVFGQGKKIYFLCISSYGECVCVSSTLNIELLDVQNVQWNPSVAIPAAVSVRGTPSFTDRKYLGLTLPRGIVLSTTAMYQLKRRKSVTWGQKCFRFRNGNVKEFSQIFGSLFIFTDPLWEKKSLI